MKSYTVNVHDNGDRDWYLNGKLHREDGPAIEYATGSKFWYRNGQLHREDGPAIEYANGGVLWFLNDQALSKEEFLARTAPATEMTVAEIERLLGKKIKIVKE